jgi:repressor LexA
MALSAKQRAIVEFIADFMHKHLYPPSVREILEGGGISSTSVVAYNLNILERLGYIARDKEVSRGIRLLKDVNGQRFALPSAMSAAIRQSNLRIPVLGRIAAGKPIPIPGSNFSPMGDQAIELTRDIIREQEGLYALEVRGNSMVDALVNDGDIVVVKHQTEANNGEMVAVWLKDKEETTLKRFYYEKSRRRVRLQPANPTMEPIYVDPANVEVQGKVVLVLRQLDRASKLVA